MGRALSMMVAGGVAGLLGWAVAEPFAPKVFPDVSLPRAVLEPLTAQWAAWQMFFSVVTGTLIGVSLGALSGWSQGSSAHLKRGALVGLLIGAAGGYIGLLMGGALAQAFLPGVLGTPFSPLPLQIIARTLVFVPFGALLGLSQGAVARSWPRAVQGMVGGIIGAGIGGALFDVIGQALGPLLRQLRPDSTEGGIVSRAVAMAITGAAIGLFIGLVEFLSRKAWLRLELGRNEGKEWIVDAPQTFIGRSETAHVPLFGDASVMPMHACIVRTGGNYRLVDGGSQIGVGLNGIRVPEAFLSHGDMINVSTFNLRFLLKNPKATVPSRDVLRSQPQAATGLEPVAPAVPSSYSLVALDGPISGQRFPLVGQELIAGREAPDLPLAFDQSASRRHAAFAPGPAGVIVRDLNSTNGTLVNGVRVQEMALRPGDTVKIGSTTFRLE